VAPNRAQRRRQGGPQDRRTLLWPLVGAAVLAVAVVAVLAALGQRSPGEQAPPGNAQGKTKGSATAPVLVMEWGDFQ